MTTDDFFNNALLVIVILTLLLLGGFLIKDFQDYFKPDEEGGYNYGEFLLEMKNLSAEGLKDTEAKTITYVGDTKDGNAIFCNINIGCVECGDCKTIYSGTSDFIGFDNYCCKIINN